MSSTKEEITPRHNKESGGEEASSQSAPIIQKPLPATPVICHRRNGSRSGPRLAARLARELSSLIANVRIISWQNVAMQELLEHMQGQLANSSQYEEGLVSVFDRLGPTKNIQSRPRISPAQARLSLIALSQPHLFNPLSVGNQHKQLQSGTAVELTHRYMHPPPKNRRK
ncbi:Hypothetical predicted protein [Olea europaea subsp. europaea]|uniref:Uncharacterized protein n=1 Tax=Olea europaea subsp. europaea TaxID=158383 RepID=A0A8S0RYA4_OLEEU|nr:Hypothetical predicted protein [Olea europaea subsp. europaea]